MWVVNDYTIINYALPGDHIKWDGSVHLIKEVDDSEDEVRVVVLDQWEETIEIFIPNGEIVPLMVWD